MLENQKIWVVIPAAGVGKRMGLDTPKQYLLLNDEPVLKHTIDIFDKHDAISEIIVSVSKKDEYWSELSFNLSKPLHRVAGGTERCDSVLNGLIYLQSKASQDDWVLVHDAARPCLRHDDLTLLIDTLSEHEVGGLLAVPVRDTIKKSFSDTTTVETTVDRSNLWHALTPQMFRFGVLFDALVTALGKKEIVTDDASAIELAGYKPRLVEGHADNLKITRPEDLALAAFYLRDHLSNKQE